MLPAARQKAQQVFGVLVKSLDDRWICYCPIICVGLLQLVFVQKIFAGFCKLDQAQGYSQLIKKKRKEKRFDGMFAML